eukprot:symbB.v1.2.033541.t1/scaffold4182.1/size43443/2
MTAPKSAIKSRSEPSLSAFTSLPSCAESENLRWELQRKDALRLRYKLKKEERERLDFHGLAGDVPLSLEGGGIFFLTVGCWRGTRILGFPHPQVWLHVPWLAKRGRNRRDGYCTSAEERFLHGHAQDGFHWKRPHPLEGAVWCFHQLNKNCAWNNAVRS